MLACSKPPAWVVLVDGFRNKNSLFHFYDVYGLRRCRQTSDNGLRLEKAGKLAVQRLSAKIAREILQCWNTVAFLAQPLTLGVETCGRGLLQKNVSIVAVARGTRPASNLAVKALRSNQKESQDSVVNMAKGI
uniref:Uncharacterized protein n=1 Tax=Romanomermis culicivorax TaxID=13658 RepID=A0A915L6M4_ROMCU